jgi:hypothetical protein
MFKLFFLLYTGTQSYIIYGILYYIVTQFILNFCYTAVTADGCLYCYKCTIFFYIEIYFSTRR